MLEISHDSEEDLMSEAVNPEDESISVEEGDWILAAGLIPIPSMDICASSTILQRLAEAFQANTEAVTLVLEYLKEFTSMFPKQSFNVLLEPKEWMLSLVFFINVKYEKKLERRGHRRLRSNCRETCRDRDSGMSQT